MTVSHPPEAMQAADLYAATFAGRHDAYSVWSGDEWKAIRKPLTAMTVLNAFTTGVPISGYFLSPASTTHLAALDLDREDGLELGQTFAAYVDQKGGKAYLEPSRRGAHVWMVLDETRPALGVRLALKALAHEAGILACPSAGQQTVPAPKTGRPQCPVCHRAMLTEGAMQPHDDRRVEFRPGADRLGVTRPGEEEVLGHCLRMPTMPHPATQKRYILIESGTWDRLPSRLVEMMPLIELCPVSVIDAAAERAPLPKLTPPRSLTHPYAEPEEEESAITLLQTLWNASGTLIPGRGAHCPAHEDRDKSLLVFKDDRRVLCYSPECILHNDARGRGTRELRQLAPRKS